jgi:hypothetical protein
LRIRRGLSVRKAFRLHRQPKRPTALAPFSGGYQERPGADVRWGFAITTIIPIQLF